MPLTTPTPFAAAVKTIARKTPIGSQLTSSEWSDIPAELRHRAMFSSRVENVRFLQRTRDTLGDFLTGARDTNALGETSLRTGSRAQFVQQMQDFALAEGMGPVAPEDAGTIKDITSQPRLELIHDINTQQADAYGDYLQGMDTDILDAYPAQRFIRVIQVKEPRQTHTQYEGIVRLKNDTAFWTRVNQDFGTPYAPWGWGCGHDVEDVDRAEAEKLGLCQPGQPITPPARVGFNDNYQTSIAGLDPDMQRLLKDSLGHQVEILHGAARWMPHASTPASDLPPVAIQLDPDATIDPL